MLCYLSAMNALIVCNFQVDLEHNQYRSFQGLTCLMQISTRTEDFIVDTLKLRIHVGPYLREVFKDPTKKKVCFLDFSIFGSITSSICDVIIFMHNQVMHGADRDIVWLQRDFGIYICNMFDTGQVLYSSIPKSVLIYTLQHYLIIA